jgi:hypothetical protein
MNVSTFLNEIPYALCYLLPQLSENAQLSTQHAAIGNQLKAF